MGVILGLGIAYTLYGIAGLLGFQIIDDKYKNYDWTKNYVRYRGISWLMVGIPWLILYRMTYSGGIDKRMLCLLVLLCGIPSMVFTIIKERTYRRMRKD